MSLPELLQEIADALAPVAAEIEGLTVRPGWSETPHPPEIDVYPASPFQIGAGFAAGNNQVFLNVRARVSMADPVSGQAQLLRMLDPADPASVEVALGEADFALADVGVSGFTQYADDAPAAQRLLGCEWRVTTFLEGAA